MEWILYALVAVVVVGVIVYFTVLRKKSPELPKADVRAKDKIDQAPPKAAERRPVEAEPKVDEPRPQRPAVVEREAPPPKPVEPAARESTGGERPEAAARADEAAKPAEEPSPK